MARIGFGITSSYCTLEKALIELKNLVELGHEIIPIVSDGVIHNDTRFGEGKKFKETIENYSNQKIVSSINDAEKFGSSDKLDLIVVAPATGNFIAKLANGITDNTVTMAVKATLRNNSPIVIGISTNDGLGFNGVNIAKLMYTKNIYFVPFGQDNYEKKPNSLISHFNLLSDTVDSALSGKQLQPILQPF